ncbi:hypothetical protein KS4_26020 [Poriferisphaera corsica]|uniref:Uncharacterized protein n=1 Tax=Poriferisphaera corsica TaxID=2528020 RepID=A0A517YWF3_9BACT|nr:hypothetical protein [Poriferisphaera corsica]QDU34532.1 hypothetical protein KS4_26020 [Poriferisphaera corsica]
MRREPQMSHWHNKHDEGWSDGVEQSDVRRELYARAEARLELARQRLEEARQKRNGTKKDKPNLKLVGHIEDREKRSERKITFSDSEVSKARHVEIEDESSSFSAPHGQMGDPITATNDPRWVLAVRVAAVMEGSIVRPEEREKLIKMGRTFGMSVFDCNLVIAILQDQARRGNLPEYCPQLAHKQLQLIPLPRQNPLNQPIEMNVGLRNSMIVAAVLLMEIIGLWVMLKT